MQLVQSRIVTDNVAAMAQFYAAIVRTDVSINDYYVEVPAGAATVGFSKCRFTEDHAGQSCGGGMRARTGESILDFRVDDLDAEYDRIRALDVDWVMGPTRQPWGATSMLFRDPERHLVNVFCPDPGIPK